MIKSLRNKLLLVNLIIISALIATSFTFIYIISRQNVESEIMEALNSAEMMKSREHERRAHSEESADGADTASEEASGNPAEGSGPASRPEPPEGEQGGAPHNIPPEGEQPRDIPEEGRGPGNEPDFSPVFAVTVDENGSVSDLSAAINVDSDFAQSAVDGVGSNDIGRVVLSGSVWQYKKMGEQTIIFTEVTERIETLRRLALTLFAVGIISLVVIFFVSLYFANRAIRPVEEAWDKQRQFVADASHELKTPLTTINTNIDVLLSHGENTIDRERKWLMYIKNEAERMSRLTNDLLSLAKIETASDTDMLLPVDLSELCERSLLTMEAVFFENKLSADSEIEEGITVMADSTKLEQLIMIFLDNAAKYTPSGGRIFLKLEKSGKNAVVSVENTGAGLSPEDCRHIFDRFYRTDKSRARESGGHGLGLAIAKSICEYHSGKISVQSEPGSYTRFTAEIPLKNGKATNSPKYTS